MDFKEMLKKNQSELKDFLVKELKKKYDGKMIATDDYLFAKRRNSSYAYSTFGYSTQRKTYKNILR